MIRRWFHLDYYRQAWILEKEFVTYINIYAQSYISKLL